MVPFEAAKKNWSGVCLLPNVDYKEEEIMHEINIDILS